MAANEPLPSITFDVEDPWTAAQLGQQVGETVSRFEHVDLPRNPNGFWRGVDDVLKMQKGTIAAVSAEFTGNYAVPQDSWEAAGYAIGIPLAMGAQIITAEAALGAEAIEGLYQGSQRAFGSVTGQLEKWGFFGKNGAEIIETGAYSNLVNSTVKDLGKLAKKEVRISQKGLNLIKQHLRQFGPVKENELMLQRLEQSLKSRQLLTKADASFYIHEATEATKMSRGMSYMKAHQFALDKYQVSPFSVYHPDVINEVNALEPGSFNNKWLDFWDEYLSNSSNPTLKK